MYNTTVRALELLGLADAFGDSQDSALRPERDLPADGRRDSSEFCAGKRAVLMIEEGPAGFHRAEPARHPAQGRRRDHSTRQGHAADGRRIHRRRRHQGHPEVRRALRAAADRRARSCRAAATPAAKPTCCRSSPRPGAPRPPSFCTGCPERPIFTAMKLVERELGPHHVSCDIGCHLFSILPPFNIGATTMGYGLGWAGAAAFHTRKRQAHHQHHGRWRLLA